MTIKISKDADTEESKTNKLRTNTYVSLNMKIRQFFEVDGFSLTVDEPTAQVTAEVSEESRALIQNAINNNILIKSKTHIPYLDKPIDIIDEIKKAIDVAKTIKDVHIHLVPIVSGKVARNYGARTVIEELIEYEKKDKNRARFIEYFEYALDKIPGPGKIIDSIMGERTVNVGVRGGVETPAARKDLI
jgi:hypothetical protein